MSRGGEGEHGQRHEDDVRRDPRRATQQGKELDQDSRQCHGKGEPYWPDQPRRSFHIENVTGDVWPLVGCGLAADSRPGETPKPDLENSLETLVE
jgi:hypothetical protein